MTTTALTGGFAVCQTRLGAKVHDPKDPGSDLGPDVPPGRGHDPPARVAHPDALARRPGSHDVPAYGFERIIDPPPLEVNAIRLLSEFHGGSLTMADTWRRMLDPATAATRDDARGRGRGAGRHGVGRLGLGGEDATGPPSTLEMAEALAGFHFPDDVWARVSTTWCSRRAGDQVDRRSWWPRWCRSTSAGSGSFVVENRHLTTADAEERVERQAREFELLKPYLVERWRALDAEEAGAAEAGRPAGRPAARSSRPMTGEPLPSRILIPVANPVTAEELIRIGASLLEPRTGELTALGIVEVPEGMPLSEGATRARQARRLLQRSSTTRPRGR